MQNLTTTDSFLPELEVMPRWLSIPFVTTSIIESIIGMLGNILVIFIMFVFGKSNTTQTLHNCFIINLALSDFVLCLFTMPLNTYRSLYVYMTFPPAFCKLADSFPAINICVSSLTIVAISVYRFILVSYPHKKPLGSLSIYIIMISIWLLAIGASSPLLVYSRSIPAFDESVIDMMIRYNCFQSSDSSCESKHSIMYRSFHVCHESWPKRSGLHISYTIFMLFLQFIFPILIICITYYQVMVKLRERFQFRFLMKRNNIISLRHEISRQRRNNILLLLIVSSYAISWLPFNISYMYFTYSQRFHPSGNKHSFPEQKFNKLSQYLPLRFLICMISAITNPFLYSYFNETFKESLRKFFSLCCPQANRRINEVTSNQIVLNSVKVVGSQKVHHNNTELNSKCNRSSEIFLRQKQNSASHFVSTNNGGTTKSTS